MTIDFEREYKRVKNLVAFKDKTKEEIITRLKEIELAKPSFTNDLDIGADFIDRKEKNKAFILAGKYLKDYTIETISDKNTLKTLIYYEIILVRLQVMLNEAHSKNEPSNLKLIDEMNRVVDKVIQLKESLGLVRDESKADSFKALELLREKFVKYREENQGSRNINCPHCGQMILLKIRTDKWDAAKHPFFKDRILTNEHLLTMYKAGKIDKEDVSKVLECSTDYIEWIIDKSKTVLNRILETKEKK